MATINMLIPNTKDTQAAGWGTLLALMSKGPEPVTISGDGIMTGNYVLQRAVMHEEFDAKTSDPADDAIDSSITLMFESVP